MARKLQIKRGAKADLPTLSQGEFGMCTDSGAEELHIGNGSANIQIPMVNTYSGDMNDLVVSGIYRVGVNTNLPASIAYGQVLVMHGANSDTVCQIGMGFNTSKLLFRSGVISDGAWTFTDWAVAYSDLNPPETSGGSDEYVAKTGDTMTGQLSIQNTADYLGLTKTREISSVAYTNAFGVGSDSTYGASASMRLTNDSGTVLGRVDAWADGSLTYKNDSVSYLPIGRVVYGTYTGTGKNADKTLTFDMPPKVVGVFPSYYKSSTYAAHGCIAIRGMTTVYVGGGASGAGYFDMALTWSGNSLTIAKNTVSMNSFAGTYGYFAIL